MSDPVRLALVITELEPGGAETCLVQLALGLPRHHFAPMVYALGSRPAEPLDRLVRRLESHDVPVHFLNARSPRQIVGTTRRLARSLLQQRAQLMQTFLFHANVLGAVASRWAGRIPTVTGVRVADPRRGRLRLERALLPWVTKVCCVSQAVAGDLRQRGRFPAERLTVIPNGVDVARFASAAPWDWRELGLPEGCRVLAYVGRLDEQKGVDWLLQAWSQASPLCPAWHLVLAGSGPYQHPLQEAARARGLAERVHFVGWRADIAGLLRASQGLVLPSRWEGMPNVVLESMAAGRPVIATRAEGVQELLGPDASDQIIDFGDTPAFVNRLRQWDQQPAVAAAWGARNQERVTREFSLECMVQRYAQLYRTLLPE